MVEQTIYYAIACALMFGGPFVLFYAYLNWEQRSYAKQKQKKLDDEFLAKYGLDAYNEMLKNRPVGFGAALDAVIHSDDEGVWHCKHDAYELIKKIRVSHGEALIGTPPYRLSDMFIDTANLEIKFYGSWSNPKKPDLKCFVDLRLKLVPQSPERTAVKYKYTAVPEDDPFAKQIITLTTLWLKSLCNSAK